MRRPLRSSGDLIADRRYAYALDLFHVGDATAAVDLFEQALERAPQWAAGWLALGRARRAAFDPAGAAAAFRESLRLDPKDEGGASLELATLDAAVTIDSAPPAYVTALFDAYAPEFDAALIERLGYSAPSAIASRLRAVIQPWEPKRFSRALDLGCGTGLAGEALRLDIAYLEGVDLSSGMAEQARDKGVYDALFTGDLADHLVAPGEAFDLILAADVFSYIGDLSRIISLIANRLSPGGYCAFTVEKEERQDWRIRESLRFAHSEDYLRRLAEAACLRIVTIEETVLRRDRGADIVGLVAILKRDGAPLSLRPLQSAGEPVPSDRPEASLH